MRAHRVEIGFDQLEPVADLQNRGGVHDVLRRRAPMQPAPAVAGPLGQLTHQRQDRVADRLGLAPEPVEIERGRVGGDRGGGLRDRLGGVGGHDAEPRLGAGQRRLDLGAAREKRHLAERSAHRFGAEHVAEQGGGERRRGSLLIGPG